MRVLKLLPLAAAATSFVIPGEEMLESMMQSSSSAASKWTDRFTSVVDSARDTSADTIKDLYHQSKEWYDDLGYECPHGVEPDHHGGHGRHPHKPKKPTKNVYELISESKYTTKLAKLINKFPDVVDALKSPDNNFTIFAPGDEAFEKIPHDLDLPKDVLKKVLQYHVVADFYPAGRVLKSRTIPTLLDGEGLTEKPEESPQRITTAIGFGGLKLNYYSRVRVIDIFATNGVIHGIESLLVPPPPAAVLVQAVPGVFSTLELALWKTGLIQPLNDTESHLGLTFFAPSNNAWARLGTRTNAFLFSKYGRKYLKALLKYHTVPKNSLYSDKLYTNGGHKHGGDDDKDDVRTEQTVHFDLPTLLKGKSLGVDIASYYRFVDVRINGFWHVGVRDVPLYDGVLHILSSVLVPPKTPGESAELLDGEISVDDLKERLDPYLEVEEEDFDDLSFEKPHSFNPYPFQISLEL